MITVRAFPGTIGYTKITVRGHAEDKAVCASVSGAVEMLATLYPDVVSPLVEGKGGFRTMRFDQRDQRVAEAFLKVMRGLSSHFPGDVIVCL